MVASLLLSYGFLVTINVLGLFFKVPWVGLRCVIVIFLYHIFLNFGIGEQYIEQSRITVYK